MPSNPNYRIGLVQMSCGPDPDANLDKAADRVREAARGGRQRRLSARAFPRPVFLPARRHCAL